jgi:hypothetical protein
MTPKEGEGEEKEPRLPYGQPEDTHGPSAVVLDKERCWLASEHNTVRNGTTHSCSSSHTSVE